MTAAAVGSGERLLREIHSREQVEARIRELADAIAAAYAGRELLLLAVAEGGRRFALALRAGLELRGVRCELGLVRAVRTRGMQLGPVRVEPLDPASLAGRDVLVIDDIAEEGRTLQAVGVAARRGRPRSLRCAVLVDKQSERRCELVLDWVGFRVAKGWVVGYGMDIDGACRDLDYLAVVEA